MQWLVKTAQIMQRSGPLEQAEQKFSTAKTVIPSSDSATLNKPGGTTQSASQSGTFFFFYKEDIYEKNAKWH